MSLIGTMKARVPVLGRFTAPPLLPIRPCSHCEGNSHLQEERRELLSRREASLNCGGGVRSIDGLGGGGCFCLSSTKGSRQGDGGGELGYRVRHLKKMGGGKKQEAEKNRSRQENLSALCFSTTASCKLLSCLESEVTSQRLRPPLRPPGSSSTHRHGRSLTGWIHDRDVSRQPRVGLELLDVADVGLASGIPARGLGPRKDVREKEKWERVRGGMVRRAWHSFPHALKKKHTQSLTSDKAPRGLR